MKPLNGPTDAMGFLAIGGRKPIDIPSTPNVLERPKPYPVHNPVHPVHNKVLDSITANINPFSPSSSKYMHFIN